MSVVIQSTVTPHIFPLTINNENMNSSERNNNQYDIPIHPPRIETSN
ncbi:MAG TPA: hypothetical protein VIY08_00870 [Candidatus Nitrosocosmicus sp.]